MERWGGGDGRTEGRELSAVQTLNPNARKPRDLNILREVNVGVFKVIRRMKRDFSLNCPGGPVKGENCINPEPPFPYLPPHPLPGENLCRDGH